MKNQPQQYIFQQCRSGASGAITNGQILKNPILAASGHSHTTRTIHRKSSRSLTHSLTSHNITADGVDISGADCSAHFAHSDSEARGDALLLGIRGQRVLRLGHADGQTTVACSCVGLTSVHK